MGMVINLTKGIGWSVGDWIMIGSVLTLRKLINENENENDNEYENEGGYVIGTECV